MGNFQPDRTLVGTLHLTAHQLIFAHPSEEKWITYSMLSSVEALPVNDEGRYSLELRCHHFLFFTLTFPTRKAVYDVFETIRRLTCLDDIDKLHAFHFNPQEPFTFSRAEGWSFYDAKAEFRRLGVETKTDQWRFTTVNQKYEFTPTYPSVLVVPKKFTDTALGYAKKYRSKGRLPVLSYLHSNLASITRSSQPMLGVKRSRSAQDEGLVQSIFATTSPAKHNLIIDARPAANAYANQALGMGTENMEFYPNCTREFMGIENIHVVRDSLTKLVEAIGSPGGPTVSNRIQLSRSNWLKHIRSILKGARLIVHHVHDLDSHVLVHCSDGWDRTAQLTAVAEICLDPFYRTVRGLATLIEKEFVTFGFKFRSRCGHLCKEKAFVDNSLVALNHTTSPSLFSNMQNRFLQYASARPSQDKETSPIFHQFLDCLFQLWIQNPAHFEFNEKLLLFLYEQAYACQYGTFLFDCEREVRSHAGLATKAYAIWSYVFSNLKTFINPIYSVPSADAPRHVLLPETKYLRYWSSLFYRRDEDLNGTPPSSLNPPPEKPIPDASEGAAAMLLRAGSKLLMDFSPAATQAPAAENSNRPLRPVEEPIEESQASRIPPKESEFPKRYLMESVSPSSSPTKTKMKPVNQDIKFSTEPTECVSFPSFRPTPSTHSNKSTSLSLSNSAPPSCNYDNPPLKPSLEALATD
ncbi:phosphatidylinositol-3-phosphatase ymr1 [Massospora cicadina]|nr:phosphatidylinositol-3-phosphatase ymr1 [Massospora cicadina]